MNSTHLGDSYIAAFDPATYLAESYDAIDAEHTFTLDFLQQLLHTIPPGFLALELGGGPALYTVALLAQAAHQIHFCDYVPANLAEVQRWLDDHPDAFDWRPYIRLALHTAGQPETAAAVAARAAQMRRKLSRLCRCDALSPEPLPAAAEKYELLFAPYCTDVAAADVAQWQQIMQNIGGLVQPGGWLIIGVTTGSSINTLSHPQGQQHFACVDLTPAQIKAGYHAAGFRLDSLHMESVAAPPGREYNGLIMAAARKSTA